MASLLGKLQSGAQSVGLIPGGEPVGAGQKSKFEKATLVLLKGKNPHGDRISCQFNPKDYVYAKKNKWKDRDMGEGAFPAQEFVSEQPQVLKLDLLFDSTSTGADVRDTTKKIWELMKVNKIKEKDKEWKEPAPCLFSWGKELGFIGAIQEIEEKFTMFLADGTPVRSELKVTMKQIKEDGGYTDKPQNPTSLGAVRKTRMVQQGDRLDLIAYQEFGDSNKWPEIARFNDIQNPLDIRPGQILGIPM